MSENKELNVAQSNGQSKESLRSTRQTLPVFTFGDMYKFCVKIYTDLGFNPIHKKDEIAEIHGVKYVSIKQKYSSAQEYGLLELHHGKGYKLTDLFMKIYKPTSDLEKNEGIIEALIKPDIHKLLVDDFNGHPLPPEENIAAKMVRSYGVKDYVASVAATVFLSNLEDNGFVDNTNTLIIQNFDKNEKQIETKNNDSVKVDTLGNSNKDVDYLEIPIKLKSGGIAYIRIPSNYESDDCERIAKFVEALK